VSHGPGRPDSPCESTSLNPASREEMPAPGQEEHDLADHSWLWGNHEQADINVVLVNGGESTERKRVHQARRIPVQEKRSADMLHACLDVHTFRLHAHMAPQSEGCVPAASTGIQESLHRSAQCCRGCRQHAGEGLALACCQTIQCNAGLASAAKNFIISSTCIVHALQAGTSSEHIVPEGHHIEANK
jgi:hypothetical protein